MATKKTTLGMLDIIKYESLSPKDRMKIAQRMATQAASEASTLDGAIASLWHTPGADALNSERVLDELRDRAAWGTIEREFRRMKSDVDRLTGRTGQDRALRQSDFLPIATIRLKSDSKPGDLNALQDDVKALHDAIIRVSNRFKTATK